MLIQKHYKFHIYFYNEELNKNRQKDRTAQTVQPSTFV